jgi:hypothetical protein
MGYRGLVEQREQARAWRAEGRSIVATAAALGVARGTVSRWVRGVAVAGAPARVPNKLERAKAAEIEQARADGVRLIGSLSERDLLIAGAALYAGEGAKGTGAVVFANSDPRMVALFLAWLSHFFAIDEAKLRMRLYLHVGLDLEAAKTFWSDITGIPVQQFHKPYRAVPDSSMRSTKHPMGCATVVLSSSKVHRQIMGLTAALLTFPCPSGVAQLAEHRPVKPIVVGSSPTPGANVRPAQAGQRSRWGQ